jgi:AraC-like DNA-binding protein/mannose-6-phosphate isomerase-like protein (cupin superfamily)
MRTEDRTSSARAASALPTHRLDPASFHLHHLRDLTYPDGSNPDSAEVVHRHDFQEIIWIESGGGRQSIDESSFRVQPDAFYLIARGQVHQFTEAERVNGLVIRFNEDFLPSPADRTELLPSALFDPARSPRMLAFGTSDASRLRGLLDQLVAEYRQPEECGRSLALGYLLRVLIVNLERALQSQGGAHRDGNDASYVVSSDFAALLGQHFCARHDVAFYAGILGVPPRLLSIHLKRVFGKTAKQLIEDRLILEAKRHLRFTSLTVKEIAYVLGYADPSYFSKTFKRLTAVSPQDFKPR